MIRAAADIRPQFLEGKVCDGPGFGSGVNDDNGSSTISARVNPEVNNQFLTSDTAGVWMTVCRLIDQPPVVAAEGPQTKKKGGKEKKESTG